MRQTLSVALSLLIGGLFFYYYSERINLAEYWVFQERDLRRAFEVLNGKMIFFGPEATGGGNLPGGLYYYILAAGQFLGPTLQGPWLVNLAFFSLSLSLLFFFMSSQVSLLGAFLAVSTLFSLQSVVGNLFCFLNVSYLPIFATVSLLAGLMAFSTSGKKQTIYWLTSCFFIGLGLQIHFSLLAVLIASFTIQVLAPRIGVARLSRSVFSLGLFAFFITLLPHFVWLISSSFGYEFGQLPPRYVGSANQSLFALARVLERLTQISWHEFFQQLTAGLFIFMPIPLLLLWVALSGQKFKECFATPWLRLLAIYVFITMIPAAYIMVSQIGRRYSWPFSIAVSIYFASLITYQLVHLTPQLKRRLSIFLFIFIGFTFLIAPLYLVLHWRFNWLQATPGTAIPLVVLLIAILFKQIRTQPLNFAFVSLICLSSVLQTIVIRSPYFYPKLMPRIENFTGLAQEIYSQTGWSTEEMRKRLYFVNPHIEQFFPRIYAEFAAQDGSINKNSERPLPDGYIASRSYYSERVRKRENFQTWILKQPLPPELKSGLQNGSIQVLYSGAKNGIAYLAYQIRDLATLPPYFQNIGYPYDIYEKNHLLLQVSEKTGVKELLPGKFLFHWNSSPYDDSVFQTGALVELRKKNNQQILEVEIIGVPISQASPWVSIVWTEAWQAPFIEVTCGNKKKNHLLVSAVGNYPGLIRYYSTLAVANNSILAPFKRIITTNCEKPINKISVGREASLIGNVFDLVTLPIETLTIGLK